MRKNTNFRRVFILMITAFLWVSSFNGFVFAGELPTETELDERVVEETQVEDEQIIVSDTETQPATGSDPVVESDTILDDNIETSTETESEVETEAEGETDDPTKVEPQSEDKKDIATQDIMSDNVEIGDFIVSLVNSKAYTSQELTVKIALEIKNVLPGYDLSGSMIKIKVPNKHLDSLKAGDIPDSTYVIADDGEMRVITYTFTDLSTSTFDFSVFLKTENYNTPDNFVVPVTAELITPDGKTFNSNQLDIEHHTAELNDHNFRINNVAIDNALHFGGIQDEINLTYISETGAFPLIYTYGFKTENIASGGEYDGSRVYSKREVTINLPTYTDYDDVERVAIIDDTRTPGWTLSPDGKTATYIEDFPLETKSRRTYNSYDGQAVLALKFPGAQADGIVQFKQTLSVKFIPKDATDYELANLPVVTFPEKTIRLTTKVKSPQLSKNAPRTMIDQLSAKQKEVSWYTYFRNTDLNLPMTDMVIEDYELDPLMKFVRLRFDTSATDFIGLDGQPGKVNIVASTPEGDVIIAENIDPIENKNFDIPENTTSVKILAVEGSIVKPGGTFRMYFDTLLKDPAGTTYKAGETEKFENKAKASGKLYESDLDLAITLPNTSVVQHQQFLPYGPAVYIEKKSSVAQALPGDKIEFTAKIKSTINTRIFEPDALENPVILDLLPPGMVFADSQPSNHITYKDSVNEGVFNDTPEIINNYKDTGRTALIWRGNGTKSLAGSGELEFATIRFNAMTNLDMYDGENTNEIFLGWSNNNTELTDPQQIGIFDGLVPDTLGISGSGKVLTRSTAQLIFSPPAMLRPRKFVQGDLNSNPIIGHGQAKIGGRATFTLEEDNRTTNNITDLIVMDVLPRKGVASSDYDLYLSAAATAQESYDVAYATKEPEISAAWLRNDANWGSLPTDLKKVTAIRFKLKSGSELVSNEKHSFTVPVDVPQDATLTSGLQANNRMYTNVSGSDNLLISNAYLDLYTYNVKGRVFNDLNGDGIYQNNETPLEGITVRLLNADGTPATRSEITTVTDSQGAYELVSHQSGDFKVAFDIPENFDLTIIPDGAIGNVNANHASKVGDLVVTDTFNLAFAPGSSTVRNAGVYSNNISITATKVWAEIPEEVTTFPKATISLYQNGVAYGTPIVLTATGNGEQEAKWENLPKFAEDGSEFVYTVKETALSNGYARTVSDDGLTITNTYDGITDNTDPENPTTAETTLTATKVWKRVEATDPLPESVNLQLIREQGQDQIDLGQKEATEAAEWKVTWDNLLAFAPDGSRYIYTVKEPVVPNGYKLTDEGKLDNGYTVTNTYYGNFENGESFNFFLRMNKEYIDADGNYLPTVNKPKAELSLYFSDGNPVLYPTKPIVIKTNHQASFTSLKFYGTNGEIIEYVMEETGVPNGYEFVEITSELSEGKYPSGTLIKYLDLTAINRYTGGEAQTVTATKVWDNIPDGTTSFPKAIIMLYQDGTEFGTAIELTAEGNGEQEAKWGNLPKFAADGSDFVYTVKETKIPDQYDMTVSEDGLVITNKYNDTQETDPTTTPPTETVEVTSSTTTKEATGAPRTGELGAQFTVLATVLLALSAILFAVQMKLRKNRFSSK